MTLFLPLLLKMTGLYACIGMGWIAARKLHLDREAISRVLFYLIVPLVFFHGVSRADLHGAALAIPFIILGLCSLLGIGGYWLASRLYDHTDRTPNILGFTTGTGNMGYFGIPVALLIFDAKTLALYMLMIIGAIFYEASTGYALATRGHFHPRQALFKILTMPTLHGALAGILVAGLQWPLPSFTEDFFLAMRGTYSVLGMMVVGMGLAGITKLELDFTFLSFTFVSKFLVWPCAMAGLIWTDVHYFHFYTENVHDAFMLIALAPLAVMSVIFATLFKNQPEKMATAVFLSTCFALVYVPFMIGWLGLGQ